MANIKNNRSFMSMADWYDVIYQDKDYSSEANNISNLLRDHKIPGNRLLEFGMGTGKHASVLASLGFQITGIEASAQMASRVPTGPDLEVLVGDICDFRIEKSFDAVICLFHVMGYINENVRLQDMFMSASRHLNANGLFVFDYWHGPAVLKQKPEVRVKRVNYKQGSLVRLAEPKIRLEDKIVEVDYTLFVIDAAGNPIEKLEESHSMRYFFIDELPKYFLEAGFELIGHKCSDTDANLSEDCWNATTILRKIA